MKFLCSRQAFANAVSNVSKGVSPKSTIPELEKLKLSLNHENLELTGYDLEFGIQSNIDVESNDVGEIAIDHHLLSGALNKCSGDLVEMEVNENFIVQIRCNDVNLQISAMSAAEYPSLPELDNLQEGMHLEQPVLNSMIRQTKYAVAVSELKPIFTGELFEAANNQLRIVGIDGFRMAIRQEPINFEDDIHFVVPKQTLEKLTGMLRDDAEELVTISANHRYVMFEFGKYIVFSRLLEGEFHKYRSSIPDTYVTEIKIDVRNLQQCLERCSLLISGKFNAPVRCTFGDDALSVWCKTGIGEIHDKIPAEVHGPEVTIGFDVRYFLDAVRNADCDQIRIQLTSNNRVTKMLPAEGESFIFLLMPVQLRK